jgi:hypothetical protein
LENGNFPVSTTVHANKKEKIEEKEGKEALPKRDKNWNKWKKRKDWKAMLPFKPEVSNFKQLEKEKTFACKTTSLKNDFVGKQLCWKPALSETRFVGKRLCWKPTLLETGFVGNRLC